MSKPEQSDSVEEIAIIGMAGRFPGALNLEQFWSNLLNGVESIASFSQQEVEDSGIDQEIARHPDYIRAAGILDDVDLFDAGFFGFSPKEAELMDPQQRLFLETSWEALENSGYDPERFEGLVGVFAGLSTSNYLYNLYTHPEVIASVEPLQIIIGNEKDHLPLRVSYKLNLRGPSVNVNTACSTSLVAVHLACQSLLLGECDAALAGGVSVVVPQKAGYIYQEEGLLSPDGHCRAFDSQAKGTVGGSGVGVVVLRRLSEAIADGDNILAVIKSSAVNNDGAFRVSYTAPGPKGQAGVIAEALALAGISPETVGYIETHGSGTSLGDAIEISSLNEVYRSQTSKKKFCALASVKTNIGHLDSAAGIAGLIKATLAVKRGAIPPSLNFTQPNPKINLEDSPFYVNTALKKWQSNGTPRRAGVSSFGIGGTNAHVILEEFNHREPSSVSRPWKLIHLSARTESALEVATDRLAQFIRDNPEADLANIAYTYQTGRKQFEHRRSIIASDHTHLSRTLETRDPKFLFSSSDAVGNRPVTFMFPGLGDHYTNMAKGLYKTEAVFREQIDFCADLFKTRFGQDLITGLYPPAGQLETGSSADNAKSKISGPTTDLRKMLRRGGDSEQKPPEPLDKTTLAQPALFAVEYATARLLMHWGIKPDAMIGYSIGEYVAACLAGVLSLEDAFYLVARRAEIIDELPQGMMLAVPLSEAEILPLLGDGLSLSAVNTPSLCVVSGIPEKIKQLHQYLNDREILCRQVRTTHAFHSSMMEPAFEPLVKEISRIKLSPPKIPYISNVTGKWITHSQATDPTYWASHMRKAVRFEEGVCELLKTPDRIFLEIGPGHSLGSFLQQHPLSRKCEDLVAVASLPHSYERQADEAFLMATLGKLWLAGVELNFKQFYSGESRRKIALPTYPFERKKYWIDRRKGANVTDAFRPSAAANSAFEPIADLGDWFSVPTWNAKTLVERDKKSRSEISDQNWLIFAGQSSLPEELARRLEEKRGCVVKVTAGTGFSKINDRQFTINPQNKEHYDRLIESLVATDKIPNHIVHLWAVGGESHLPANEDFQQGLWRGVFSLLFLAQSLSKHGIAKAITNGPSDSLIIDVLTNNMQAVTGDEPVQPVKATALGPCKTIPQEYPNIVCRSIDLSLPPAGSWKEERLADRLLLELQTQPEDLMVAYRGNNRFAQAFKPLRIGASEKEPEKLRTRGVYLITGGLGNDSLARAKYLAEKFQARLVLTSRSGLPARSDWNDWLATQGGDDPTSKKIKKVIELEELGAQVLVLKADVADEAQMRDAIRVVDETFGDLNGVIHAAGITDAMSSRAIEEVGYEECDWHFRPKIYGCLTLEKVLKARALDFCLLTSSVASITGGVGLLAYTSASIFMDAFAAMHNQNDPVWWTSLNWQGVSEEETVEAFRRVISLDHVGQIIASPEDLQASISRRINLDFLHENKPSQIKLHSRPNLRNPFVAPRNEVELKLAGLLEQLLGIEQVGVHDNFLELGADSLLGVQFVARVRATFQVKLTLRTLFESPTIADFALALEEALISEIDALTEEEAKGLV